MSLNIISSRKSPLQAITSLISWGWRIHRLDPCREVRRSYEDPVYDTKLSEGEVSFLGLWGVWSTPSLTFIFGQLHPVVVLPVRVPSIVETPILELWVMQRTASLRLILVTLWLGVVVPVWVPSIDQLGTNVLDMILPCIWWRDTNSGALDNAENRFIIINPSYTLNWSGSTCLGSIYWLDRN